MSLPRKALHIGQIIFPKEAGEAVQTSAHAVRRGKFEENGKIKTVFFKPISKGYSRLSAIYTVAASVSLRCSLGDRAAEDRLVYDEKGKICGTASIALPNYKPLKPYSLFASPTSVENPDVEMLLIYNVAALLVAIHRHKCDDRHPDNWSLFGLCDWDMVWYHLLAWVRGPRFIDGKAKPMPEKAMVIKPSDIDNMPIINGPTYWPAYASVLTLNSSKINNSYKPFQDLNKNPVCQLTGESFQDQEFDQILRELATYDPEMLENRLTDYLGDEPFLFSQSPYAAKLTEIFGDKLFNPAMDDKPFVASLLPFLQKEYDEYYKANVFKPPCEENISKVRVWGFNEFLLTRPESIHRTLDWADEQNRKAQAEVSAGVGDILRPVPSSSNASDQFGTSPSTSFSLLPHLSNTRFNRDRMLARYHQIWRDSFMPQISDLLYENELLITSLAKALRDEPQYELCLFTDGVVLEPGKLYVREIEGKVAYSVLSSTGEQVRDYIMEKVNAPVPFDLTSLNAWKSAILCLAAANGHIQGILAEPQKPVKPDTADITESVALLNGLEIKISDLGVNCHESNRLFLGLSAMVAMHNQYHEINTIYFNTGRRENSEDVNVAYLQAINQMLSTFELSIKGFLRPTDWSNKFVQILTKIEKLKARMNYTTHLDSKDVKEVTNTTYKHDAPQVVDVVLAMLFDWVKDQSPDAIKAIARKSLGDYKKPGLFNRITSVNRTRQSKVKEFIESTTVGSEEILLTILREEDAGTYDSSLNTKFVKNLCLAMVPAKMDGEDRSVGFSFSCVNYINKALTEKTFNGPVFTAAAVQKAKSMPTATLTSSLSTPVIPVLPLPAEKAERLIFLNRQMYRWVDSIEKDLFVGLKDAAVKFYSDNAKNWGVKARIEKVNNFFKTLTCHSKILSFILLEGGTEWNSLNTGLFNEILSKMKEDPDIGARIRLLTPEQEKEFLLSLKTHTKEQNYPRHNLHSSSVPMFASSSMSL